MLCFFFFFRRENFEIIHQNFVSFEIQFSFIFSTNDDKFVDENLIEVYQKVSFFSPCPSQRKSLEKIL